MIRRNAVLLLLFSLSTPFFSHAAEPDVRHSFLTADSSKNLIAIIGDDSQLQWSHQIGPLHDLHLLENGNVLFQDNWTHIVEMNPDTNQVVWEFTAGQNTDRKVEVHAFERLANGNTMVVESGTSRILEVDPNGKVVKTIPLQVKEPHHHRDTRLVRKLDSGNYLVCHEGEGLVAEYNADGKIVWQYKVPLFGEKPRKGHGVEGYGNQCFAALRLKNGNTLISTGNGHRVIEVTPKKEIVWSLEQNELPGIQLAWVTTLQVLPNGNIVLGNCHAGPENPQIIEVTRDKKVVWSFKDFDRFGNALTNTQILTTNGKGVN
ncbi:beta-propeller domain-containing protein [Rubinisphaera margarita]|uniref:beta-propeller domain-containing protein n=1 Tax=Rubinisphaera margarita TaxID=2909586 RepID=UPI001EE7CF26|nr:arylsulfotransferase family protein [Rubinisphaera margarita]MCG6155567.1 arylsulfotransferase family protein [Rubinisphaera margarita]